MQNSIGVALSPGLSQFVPGVMTGGSGARWALVGNGRSYSMVVGTSCMVEAQVAAADQSSTVKLLSGNAAHCKLLFGRSAQLQLAGC